MTVMQSIVSGPSQCQSEGEKKKLYLWLRGRRARVLPPEVPPPRGGWDRLTVTGICAKDKTSDSHTVSAASLLTSHSPNLHLSQSQPHSDPQRVLQSQQGQSAQSLFGWREGGREGGEGGGPGPSSGVVWCGVELQY